jgi:hypothetical protein
MSDSPVLYCTNHPTVETTLRCKTCDRPICPKCAVRTPTGYSCKDCVRQQQRIFHTARWYDYPLAFVVAAFLSFLAALLAALIGTLAGFLAWFVLLAAVPTAGVLIAEAVRLATRRHRARSLFLTAAAGVVVGALLAALPNLLLFNLLGIIFQGIYVFLATPLVYGRLAGIRLTR